MPSFRPRSVTGGADSFRLLVRRGLFGYLSVTVATIAAAMAMPLPRVWVIAVIAICLIWQLSTLAAIPAFERATSFAPASQLIVGVAFGALAFLVAGGQPHSHMRLAVGVLLFAASGSFVAAIIHRQLMSKVPTLIVGTDDKVDDVRTRWQDRDDMEVVDTISWPADAPAGPSELNKVTHEVMRSLKTRGGARVVIAADDALASANLRHLAWALQRAEVECLVLTDMSEHIEHMRVEKVADQMALALDPPNQHLLSLALKTFADRVSAGVLLLLGAPVLALIALAIKLDSPGPVIFRQERTGKDGAPFVMYKFRSMHPDAEAMLEDLIADDEGSGPLFKMANDPRVTRVGRFLRKTSLDELPQLFNVLLGDMSLVGPRPALERETAQYSPWVWRRLHVKPGMTGLWQVSGRSSLSWEDSIKLDLHYANSWSLWLDLRILLRTVSVVVTGRGAW